MSLTKLPKEFQPTRIQEYFYCRECWHNPERRDEACFLVVGWTIEGFQVFCERCSQSVIDIDFEGRKVLLI